MYYYRREVLLCWAVTSADEDADDTLTLICYVEKHENGRAIRFGYGYPYQVSTRRIECVASCVRRASNSIPREREHFNVRTKLRRDARLRGFARKMISVSDRVAERICALHRITADKTKQNIAIIDPPRDVCLCNMCVACVCSTS